MHLIIEELIDFHLGLVFVLIHCLLFPLLQLLLLAKLLGQKQIVHVCDFHLPKVVLIKLLELVK